MMYRSSDLGHLSVFIKNSYWVMPVDWLFRHYNKMYLYGNPKWAIHVPTVFRHIGMYSSLDGQVRKLEDLKQRNITRIYAGNNNPPANITTSIKDSLPGNSIHVTYDLLHHGMFWGKDIAKGDYILIEFIKKIRITKLIVESGGPEPEDYFGGANIFTSHLKTRGECKNSRFGKLLKASHNFRCTATILMENPVSVLRL